MKKKDLLITDSPPTDKPMGSPWTCAMNSISYRTTNFKKKSTAIIMVMDTVKFSCQLGTCVYFLSGKSFVASSTCRVFEWYLPFLANLFWKREGFFRFCLTPTRIRRKTVADKRIFSKIVAVEFDLVTSSLSRSSVLRCQIFPHWKVFRKVAFSECVYTRYLWTEHQSVKKNLRVQRKPDTCGWANVIKKRYLSTEKFFIKLILVDWV